MGRPPEDAEPEPTSSIGPQPECEGSQYLGRASGPRGESEANDGCKRPGTIIIVDEASEMTPAMWDAVERLSRSHVVITSRTEPAPDLKAIVDEMRTQKDLRHDIRCYIPQQRDKTSPPTRKTRHDQRRSIRRPARRR